MLRKILFTLAVLTFAMPVMAKKPFESRTCYDFTVMGVTYQICEINIGRQ